MHYKLLCARYRSLFSLVPRGLGGAGVPMLARDQSVSLLLLLLFVVDCASRLCLCCLCSMLFVLFVVDCARDQSVPVDCVLCCCCRC